MYRCLVHVNEPGRPLATMSSHCSCPLTYDCKHVVALLLHMREAGHRRQTPRWRLILDEVANEAPRTSGRGAPLALDIMLSQQEQIGQMRGWLTLWNLPWGGPGMTAWGARRRAWSPPATPAR